MRQCRIWPTSHCFTGALSIRHQINSHSPPMLLLLLWTMEWPLSVPQAFTLSVCLQIMSVFYQTASFCILCWKHNTANETETVPLVDLGTLHEQKTGLCGKNSQTEANKLLSRRKSWETYFQETIAITNVGNVTHGEKPNFVSGYLQELDERVKSRHLMGKIWLSFVTYVARKDIT